MSFGAGLRGEAKLAALWVFFAVAVLCIALGGIFFVIGAFYLWLSHMMPASGAAAVTGAVMLGLAVLVAVIGGMVIKRRRRAQPSLLVEFGGGLGLAVRLVGLMVRSDPRKAMILSVIAGALAEYITSDRKS
jgi:ABC-type thiamin/hydroxymethylpyrimidine transport system permease subunit